MDGNDTTDVVVVVFWKVVDDSVVVFVVDNFVVISVDTVDDNNVGTALRTELAVAVVVRRCVSSIGFV